VVTRARRTPQSPPLRYTSRQFRQTETAKAKFSVLYVLLTVATPYASYACAPWQSAIGGIIFIYTGTKFRFCSLPATVKRFYNLVVGRKACCELVEVVCNRAGRMPRKSDSREQESAWPGALVVPPPIPDLESSGSLDAEDNDPERYTCV
jgi:hypothetical protein